ncbi:RNA polymerase sigma-70 factor [Fulvivirgaceae bacterium BMA10]|uniref:RNA polymerase sigma-70 factor n=1 Tax=Splendidivirga corallicola TaxID=3051826 RepID=A0ABT8KUC7_9BACT|nr:RNA polymerase sigma-70 factor [Fulvivirgaceae bacterium BMA10]
MLTKDQFEGIFNSFYVDVKNYVYYKIADVHRSEDIAQEAFLVLWEKRDQVRIETVKSFLYAIASNLTVDHFRKENVKLRFTKSAEKESRIPFAESPQYLVEFNEFEIKLQEAISNLTEKQRVVFLMNRIDGLKYAEIAERLGISIKTVEKRMGNTLKELRKKINFKV